MKKIRILIITCLSMVLIIATYKTKLLINEYKEAENEYQKLQVKYVREKTDIQQNIDNEEKITIKENEKVDINWEALEEINPDIIGWIIITDSQVNYPIVKSNDNEEYLHKTYEGKTNSSGAIFMDFRNDSSFKNDNTIIYGHNMKNGSMFKTLNYYSDINYFKEGREIWIYTKKWKRQYLVISAHVAAATESTYTLTFQDMNSYSEHLVNEKKKSIYETGNYFNEKKPIITLTTCRGKQDRFVLVLQEKED